MSSKQSTPPSRAEDRKALETAIRYLRNEAVSLGFDKVAEELNRALAALRDYDGPIN